MNAKLCFSLFGLGKFPISAVWILLENYVFKDYITWFISNVLEQTRTKSKLKFMLNPFSICGICVKLSRKVFFLWISEVSVRKSFMLSKTKHFTEKNFHKFIQFVNPDRRRWEGSEKCKLTSKNVIERKFSPQQTLWLFTWKLKLVFFPDNVVVKAAEAEISSNFPVQENNLLKWLELECMVSYFRENMDSLRKQSLQTSIY